MLPRDRYRWVAVGYADPRAYGRFLSICLMKYGLFPVDWAVGSGIPRNHPSRSYSSRDVRSVDSVLGSRVYPRSLLSPQFLEIDESKITRAFLPLREEI